MSLNVLPGRVAEWLSLKTCLGVILAPTLARTQNIAPPLPRIQCDNARPVAIPGNTAVQAQSPGKDMQIRVMACVL